MSFHGRFSPENKALKNAANGYAGLDGSSKLTVGQLPLATGAAAGAVVVGTNLTITAGTLSLSNANVLAAIGFTPAGLTGNTFTGTQVMPAATTALASLRIPHGTAPTTPINGDLWTTTGGVLAYINGATQTLASREATQTFTGANTFSGGVTLSAGNLTLFQDPSAAMHAVTLQYLQSSLGGVQLKTSVRAATTANHALTGLTAIDGVTPIAGNRILVKNQTTASANGIYVAAAGAWARSTDADVSAEVLSSTIVMVEEGTLGADTGWLLSTNNAIVLGTTSLTFTQVLAPLDTAATANTAVKRDASAVIFGANSATLGATTSAGAAIVADANGYMPGAAQWNSGLKRPVRVATEGPLPAYTRATNVITGTGLNSLNTAGIDGIVNLAVGDRILFKDGVSTADNGVYDVTTVGVEGTTNFVLTRSPGADTSAEVRIGMTVPVSVGTENASSVYMLSNTTNPTLNSTGLTFVRVASALGAPVKQPVRLATNAALPANTRTGDVITGVGIANPATAPTLSTATTGGTVADGTYFVSYSYVTAAGQTMVSPTETITTTGGGTSTITVTLPANPTGVTLKDVYFTEAGGASGTETDQGSTATTSFVLTAPPVVGAAVPVANTSYALIGLIDSTAPALGNRILVKDEVTGANNGIYVVTTVGSASANFVLTRAADADSSVEMIPGLMVTVHLGTANADSLWLLTNDTVTINSTSLIFVKLTNVVPSLYKNPVRLVTTAPLAAYTRVGNVITANANGALGTIDGVTTAAGNRILLKDGAAAADNGIYTVTTLGTASVPFVLTRTEDADSSAEMSGGVMVYALAGVQFADTLWTMTSPDTTITLNTTALTFAQYGSTSQKDPCRVATAAALPAYTRTTSTINGTGLNSLNTAGIDGITNLAVGNRVLLKNGVSAVDNGIWVITALGVDATSNFQLVRAGDADSSARMRAGSTTLIEEGTTNADTLWALTTNNNITLNTTALTFSQIGAVTATAATPLTLVLRDSAGRAQFADPVAAQDAATMGYVNAQTQGTTTKDSVRMATTTALPSNTYAANVITGVGIANPTVLPGATPITTGGTIPLGTFLVCYTWQTALGETMRSPERTFTTTTATSRVTITNPALPAGATATKVYITQVGGASDTETFQYSTVLTSVLRTSVSVGAALPSSNTTFAPIGTIDGVTPAAGNRVLVKNESTAANNGLYTVTTVGDGSTTAFVLTRTADANSDVNVKAGMSTLVEEGASNADTGWILATDNVVTLGTTSLTFTQFSGTNVALKVGNNVFTGSNEFQGLIKQGDDNQDILEKKSAEIETHNRTTETAVSGNIITSITEKDGVTVVKTTTFSYLGNGNLNTIVIVAGGKTTTVTYSYDGNGNFTGTTRTVV